MSQKEVKDLTFEVSLYFYIKKLIKAKAISPLTSETAIHRCSSE